MALLHQHQRPIGSAARVANGRRGQTVRCTASSPPRLASISRRAKRVEELKDPAQIGASGSASQRFTVLPQYEPLQTYMLLPVEQYFVLDPKQIAHLGGNRFVLTVPRINLFNLWLEAVVEVTVNTYPGGGPGGPPPRVVLEADNCRITGSEAVEGLQLDQRFTMRFVTELTWSSAPAVVGATGAAAQNGEIRANSQVDVWSEVIPPFHLLPREVLCGTCNGVLRGLMSSLLPLFVRMLAQDYQRWAADPAYRANRAERSKAMAS